MSHNNKKHFLSILVVLSFLVPSTVAAIQITATAMTGAKAEDNSGPIPLSTDITSFGLVDASATAAGTTVPKKNRSPQAGKIAIGVNAVVNDYTIGLAPNTATAGGTAFVGKGVAIQVGRPAVKYAFGSVSLACVNESRVDAFVFVLGSIDAGT